MKIDFFQVFADMKKEQEEKAAAELLKQQLKAPQAPQATLDPEPVPDPLPSPADPVLDDPIPEPPLDEEIKL